MAAAATPSSPDSIRKFYLVPACETDADPNLISERMNSHLSRMGEQQAAKVAKKLSSVPFSIIYCSDSRNAKQTAGILAQDRVCEIITKKDLREFFFGELEGHPISWYIGILNKAIGSLDYNTLEKRRSFHVVKDAENVQEAFDRISKALKAIASMMKEQNIVVVTHAKLINAFVANIFFRDIQAVQVKKGGMVVFDYHSDQFSFSGGRKISVAGKTPQEGMFEHSLLKNNVEEGWGNKISESEKNRFIALADSYFAGIDDQKILDELAKIYAYTAGHKSEAKLKYLKAQYRERLLKYAKHLIMNSIEQPKGLASVIKGITAPGSPWINQLLLLCYEFGDTEMLSTYVNGLFDHFRQECRMEDFVIEWAEKIYRDFQEHKPISFSMLAKMIRDRRLSYNSISQTPPFNKPKLSFDILKKLGALKVKEAEDALCWEYYYNQLGLSLSMKERLEGLLALVEQGNEMAQWKMGQVYAYNQFNDGEKCNLTEDQRREGMARLQEIEGSRKHNFFITLLYWNNGFSDLPYQLSIQERIDSLQARAKSGDYQSINYLLEMCRENRLGDQKGPFRIDLKWDAQQRLNKVKELEVIANETGCMNENCIGGTYAGWMRDNEIGSGENRISLNLSIDERMKWLEDSFFKKNNLEAGKILTEAYAHNRLINYNQENELNMPFGERLAKIHELALKGSRPAALRAAKFYSNDQFTTHPFTDVDHSHMDDQTKSKKFFELMLDGGHYDLGKYCVFNESIKGAVNLILATLHVLHRT